MPYYQNTPEKHWLRVLIQLKPKEIQAFKIMMLRDRMTMKAWLESLIREHVRRSNILAPDMPEEYSPKRARKTMARPHAGGRLKRSRRSPMVSQS